MKQQIIDIQLTGQYRYNPSLNYEIYHFHNPNTGRRVAIFATSMEDAYNNLEARCPSFWKELVYDGK